MSSGMPYWIDWIKKGFKNPDKVKNYVLTNIEDVYITRKDDYVLNYEEELGYQRGNVLISYFVDPFYYFDISPRFRRNSNRWQARQIARIFNRLGFSADIYHHARDKQPDDYSKYDILFGVEPNFVDYSRNMPSESLKIYYATSEHWSVVNSAEKERIKKLEERRNVTVDPERHFQQIPTDELADAIVTIGESTKESYVDHFSAEKPILPISISTQSSLASQASLNNKNFEQAKNRFLWLGGSGYILKGLDITLEIFSELDDLELFVCGGVRGNEDFTHLYSEELFDQENIHFIGWVDLDSRKFKRIANSCAFHLYPSASDGIPSSLAMTMRTGLIPIAPIDILESIDYWGIPLQNRDIEHVKSVVRQVSESRSSVVKRQSVRSYTIGNTEFTRERYTEDMLKALGTIIEDSGVG